VASAPAKKCLKLLLGSRSASDPDLYRLTRLSFRSLESRVSGLGSMERSHLGALRRRGSRTLAAAVLLVLAAIVVVVLVRDDGGDDGPTRPADRLRSLEVRADDLPSRWDAVVDDLGSGDRLGELSWAADEGLGLERAEQTFASWGLIELYRRADEVVAVDLVGQMVSDADRTRFRADAIAAVAAALDEDVDGATEIVDEELGFAAPDPRPSASAEHGGATIAVDRSATSAELRISRSKG
jgi:hypothetical protein